LSIGALRHLYLEQYIASIEKKFEGRLEGGRRTMAKGQKKVAAEGEPTESPPGFFKKSGKVIVALTVQEILEEQIARKLA
jgi:hypothetical protein